MIKQPVISVNHLTVHFTRDQKKTVALDNLSFDISKGDFVVMVGPSGSGKSTLLNVLAGYIPPTSGTASSNGSLITGPSQTRGVVFQSSSLFPWYNVERNIGYSLRLSHESNQQERVNEMIKEIKLEGFEKHYPYELSGGMRQRVSLARSLINNPDILLLDEPFGALDALTRLSMQQLLQALWFHSNRTVFMITHDIEEAVLLATRVIVLSQSPGRILQEFEVNFSERMCHNPQYQPTLDSDFLTLKNDILELIA